MQHHGTYTSLGKLRITGCKSPRRHYVSKSCTEGAKNANVADASSAARSICILATLSTRSVWNSRKECSTCRVCGRRQRWQMLAICFIFRPSHISESQSRHCVWKSRTSCAETRPLISGEYNCILKLQASTLIQHSLPGQLHSVPAVQTHFTRTSGLPAATCIRLQYKFRV